MWDLLILNPFVNVLLLIYTLVKNFGLAIILFTLLIRLITHPLMVQQIKGATAMQDMQKDKRWLEIQKKYKDDREKLAQEQMKFYKEIGYNPFSSCLPTVIQLPLIFALYQSINAALAATPLDLMHLTQRIYPGFINVAALLPMQSKFLWMDLSLPERLYLPFLPTFGIPVIAILVVISTYLQQKLMTPTTPPSGDGADASAGMMKAMNLYMPFLMGWIALSYSSGLSLYFLAGNIIGILQYAALGRVNWRNVIPSQLLPSAAKTNSSKKAK